MQTVSQSDPIHGGFDNSSPSGGIPSAVTVTLAAGSAPGSILGGYSDPAQAIASPGPLGSPSVVTLWPTAQTDAAAPAAPTVAATAVGSAQPGAANTSSCTTTLAPQPAPTVVSSAEPSSKETSSSLLTSTLLKVISDLKLFPKLQATLAIRLYATAIIKLWSRVGLNWE